MNDIYCEYCNDGRFQCLECQVCYIDMEFPNDEPTDAEIDAEIERQMAASEAMTDNL